MAVKNTILAIPLTSLTLTADDDFEPIFPVSGLPEACFALRIINDSADNVTISFDGINAADIVFADSVALLPGVYALQPNTLNANFSKGTQIYAMGSIGVIIHVAGYYQPQT